MENMEKINLYGEDGKVKDPEIARKMAAVEAPYHEVPGGFLGFAKRKSIKEGQKAAKDEGERIVERMNDSAEKAKEEEKIKKEAADFITQNKKIIIPAEKIPEELKSRPGSFWIKNRSVLYFDKDGNVAECILPHHDPTKVMSTSQWSFNKKNYGDYERRTSYFLGKIGFSEGGEDILKGVLDIKKQIDDKKAKEDRDLEDKSFKF
jgi:hypothetical protein